MLKIRVITALILMPLVVAAVFLLTPLWFALLSALIMLLGGWELSRIAGVEQIGSRIAYLFILSAALAGAWIALDPALRRLAYLAVACWWALFLLLALSGLLNRTNGNLHTIRVLVPGSLLLCSSWAAINDIRAIPESGHGLLMFLLLLIWIADSGAYFSGRAFGRSKLAPVISPGKTWEGVLGALAGAAVMGITIYYLDWLGHFDLAGIVLLCVLTASVSVGGDLWESLLKRRSGIKDSGNILPGHGGVLDRIDSLIAAAPFFFAGLVTIGYLQ